MVMTLGTVSPPSWGRPRIGTPRNPDRPTFGPAVDRFAELLGHHLLPWQRHVLDVALEVAPDPDKGGALGFHYRTVVIEVQRRAGKTTMTFLRQAHRAWSRPGSFLYYAAQSRTEGLDIWRQQTKRLLLPHADRLRFTARDSNGSEALRYANGSELQLFTPSDSALVGLDSDDVVIDEARFHTPERGLQLEGAISPTQATRDGQLWIVSSPGTLGVSEWLWSWRQRGLNALTDPESRIAFFSYSVPDEADPLDIETVSAYHPAVGHTIGRRFLTDQRKVMQDPYDFAREYAGRWTKAVSQAVPMSLWNACAADDRPMPAPGDVSLAFATAPDRSAAAIGAAWRVEGVLHVALLDCRPETSWLPDRLRELHARWKPAGIAYGKVTGATATADALRKDRLRLTAVPFTDYATACQAIHDTIIARQLVHHGQADLDAAVEGVAQRNYGERWLWSQKHSRTLVAPLEAITLAMWQYDHRRARGAPVMLTA